ncbi:nucleotidyltransferase-like protein [Metabacillus sp. GX 13764]|uniref:nucleotidyltransferase-like protein n=1 Tax=Metabacillus kandeliae TaxID=2900151 RepID=UPI001E4E0A4F|nr:nucleotidyltransferase-like protein [Metabacillus kandeliae]MCD7036411.1 nucleotidyltransferase-like protein [Metabacillus kandeliae]
MENILRPIYQERASHPDTLAVIMVERRNQTSPETDNFDAALLIIVKEADSPVYIKHYEFEGQQASLHIVTDKQIREWILLGTNRRIVDWLMNGKLLFDRNEYLAQLIDKLHTFPFSERKLKIGLEYSKLIRRYLEGKKFFEAKQFLDAYNHIVHALHHLARLEVIDNGFYPETTVWSQVRQIEPQVYKLYQELIDSGETLEKRLELLFLASDFLIHSKAEIGAAHLLSIMEEKEIWYFAELQEHPEIKYYSVDLGILIEFLIEKQLIHTVRIETKGQEIYHRAYKVAKNLLT